MDNQSRKAAVAAWKERKAIAGIYSVTCAASGEAWVGSAPRPLTHKWLGS